MNETNSDGTSGVLKLSDTVSEWENCMEDRAFVYFSYALFSIILIPTVLGNTLILTSVIKFRHLRTNMHILIGNLAVSDLFIGVCILLQVISGIDWEFVTTKYFCLSVSAVFVMSLGTSSFNLLIMSIERFTAIQYPLRHKILFTKRTTYISITFCWTYHLILASLPFMGLNNYRGEVTVCDTDLVWEKTYDVVLFGGTLATVVINCILCGFVARTVLKKRSIMRYSSSNSESNASIGGNFRKTQMTLIVFVVFAICWLPYLILSFVLTFHRTGTIRCARQWSISTGIINSATNWIIYGLANKSFREAFKLILKRQNSAQINNLSSSE